MLHNNSLTGYQIYIFSKVEEIDTKDLKLHQSQKEQKTTITKLFHTVYDDFLSFFFGPRTIPLVVMCAVLPNMCCMVMVNVPVCIVCVHLHSYVCMHLGVLIFVCLFLYMFLFLIC